MATSKTEALDHPRIMGGKHLYYICNLNPRWVLAHDPKKGCWLLCQRGPRNSSRFYPRYTPVHTTPLLNLMSNLGIENAGVRSQIQNWPVSYSWWIADQKVVASDIALLRHAA